jgi:hypothetical protein
MKPTIVSRSNEHIHCRHVDVWPVFAPWFDWEPWSESKTYDPESTVFVCEWWRRDSWINEMRDRGYRTAIDTLWEPHIPAQDHYEIKDHQWFWLQTGLWFQSRGYHRYVPQKDIEYPVLMMMRYRKDFRERFVELAGSRIDSWLYSRDARGLPGDTDEDQDNDFIVHINEYWYNSTFMSMILESTCDGAPFLTEKTFKAIAFQHPFMILGAPGSLETLRSWGFESFSNLFDESYDYEQDLDTRIEILLKNIDNISSTVYDSETQVKLSANRDRLFDTALIKEKIKSQIIFPLLEYVNAQT